MKHPRTNRVWLRRLAKGPARLQASVERGDAIQRLRRQGLVLLVPLGAEIQRGEKKVLVRVGTAAMLTPEGIDAANQLGASP